MQGLCSETEEDSIKTERANMVISILESYGVKNLILSNSILERLSHFNDLTAQKVNKCVVFKVK